MSFEFKLRDCWVKFKNVNLFGLIITTPKWLNESFEMGANDDFVTIRKDVCSLAPEAEKKEKVK